MSREIGVLKTRYWIPDRVGNDSVVNWEWQCG